MSYFTGTANGTNDLLDIIKTNALAQGYTLNRDRVDGSPSSRELIMTAVNGAVIGLKLYTVDNTNGSNITTDDNVNIALNVGNGYDDLETFFNQPGSYRLTKNDKIGAYCKNYSIKYHLSITSGRIFCAYFIDSYLFTFYLGDYFPYDTPINIPDSLFISGNDDYDSPVDTTKELSNCYNIVGGNDYDTGAYDNGNNWIYCSVSNSWNSSSFRLCISPFNNSATQDSTILFDNSGGYVFYPVVLSNNTTNFLFGELDGIYRVSSYGLKQGDIINDGNDDYIVFKRRIMEASEQGLFAFKLI